MDWLEPIDLYCERTSAGFWEEPFNAISNISIMIAGLIFLIPLLRKKYSASSWLWTSSILAIIVGLGSFLFHTFANRWSQLADIIPINIFVIVYVIFAFLKIFKWSWQKITILLITSILILLSTSLIHVTWMNGSQAYLPVVILFLLMSLLSSSDSAFSKKYYRRVIVIFFFSLIFRTADLNFCETWPLGTHFIWHLLNGLLTYTLLVPARNYETRLCSTTKSIEV